MRILLIEDDSSIRNVLRISLEAEMFAVDEAEDGAQGSFMARTNDYDIIILDNVLPQKQGGQVCREIRENGNTTPILMLSVKSEILEKIELLNTGVDDYMTKPFSFEELLARIKTIIRRPRAITEKIIKIKNIEFNSDKQLITLSGKEIYLTKKEFSLMEFLMKNKDKVISRGQIMENVWDINSNPFSNTIEAHILSIRRKIGDSNKKIIQSIPGRGYRISETC